MNCLRGVKSAFVENETKEIFIGHGRALGRAEFLKKRIENELKIPVTILWIGPIVVSTCGPGVIGTFCRGKEVIRYEGESRKSWRINRKYLKQGI